MPELSKANTKASTITFICVRRYYQALFSKGVGEWWQGDEFFANSLSISCWRVWWGKVEWKNHGKVAIQKPDGNLTIAHCCYTIKIFPSHKLRTSYLGISLGSMASRFTVDFHDRTKRQTVLSTRGGRKGGERIKEGKERVGPFWSQVRCDKKLRALSERRGEMIECLLLLLVFPNPFPWEGAGWSFILEPSWICHLLSCRMTNTK